MLVEFGACGQVLELIQRCWSGQKKGEHQRPTFEQIVWELQDIAVLPDEDIQALCVREGASDVSAVEVAVPAEASSGGPSNPPAPATLEEP